MFQMEIITIVWATKDSNTMGYKKVQAKLR